MARGLLGVGQEQKKQAYAGLLGSARIEAQQDIAEQSLKQQKEMAEATTAGTLTGSGAAIGFMVGGGGGAAIGAAIGFLSSKLFG
jgi:F0F1-type ATP synthase assembly protein I